LGYLLTGNREQAEDLVHDAFVKLAGRFGDLRGPDNFSAYLRRTMVNISISRRRRERLERGHLERTSAVAVTELPDVATRDRFRAALMTLPVRQRAAIVLRHYEDLSEEQAADLLECSIAAVRSALFRGMETLRAELGGER
jgi:RNA polymerase sigma-70 factor (sigma-E family)